MEKLIPKQRLKVRGPIVDAFIHTAKKIFDSSTYSYKT